ncbi:hypothetical protein BJ166DRAFT_188029 [Pestalotiopsis sp. NC0098]|nr:hypothetical protein BJ166DRAFT_188029 [Pestalotiopsis sp. NC0098]
MKKTTAHVTATQPSNRFRSAVPHPGRWPLTGPFTPSTTEQPSKSIQSTYTQHDFERKRSRSPEADTPLPPVSHADEYQDSSIEPSSPGAYHDDDEFEPSDFDEASLADSTSIGSSVYGHSFHNGRRYHKVCSPSPLSNPPLKGKAWISFCSTTSRLPLGG